MHYISFFISYTTIVHNEYKNSTIYAISSKALKDIIYTLNVYSLIHKFYIKQATNHRRSIASNLFAGISQISSVNKFRKSVESVNIYRFKYKSRQSLVKIYLINN